MPTKQTWNFVALMSALPLTSFSTPAQALLAPPTCEMHVWASPYIQNDVTGIFPGGALAAVETQGYRNKLKRGKSTVTQTLLTNDLLMKSLRESTIGQRLNIPADKFILETDPNAQQAFIKSSASEADGCRYGFTFQILNFEKSTVYGKQLTLFYNITDRTVRPKSRNIHWYNSEGLKDFDPTASDEQISAVLEDGLRRVIDDIVAKKLP